VSHSKYKAGCNECKKQSKLYRTGKLKQEEIPHYKNGIPKPTGIRLEENWKRLNTLGKELTEKNKKV